MLDTEVVSRAREAGLLVKAFNLEGTNCIALFGPEEFVIAAASEKRDEVAAAIDWLRYGRFEMSEDKEQNCVFF